MSSEKKQTWFHGSPMKLELLKSGNTITRNEKLARAFSTRPGLVSIDDNGRIKHDGQQNGRVYRINEPVLNDDIYEHPASAMEKGLEWITGRDLKLEFLYDFSPSTNDILSEEEINDLMTDTPG